MLTPDDVHHKWFTTVRLREGYDLREVDDFLREVEYTLDRLYKENGSLREQQPTVLHVPDRDASSEESETAARIIALAEQTAGQTLTAARAEADEIIRRARDNAEQLERDARDRAEQIERDAAGRTYVDDRQMRQTRADLDALENSKLAVVRQLTELRTLVAEYRTRFQSSLGTQFDDVERRTEEFLAALPGPSPAPPGTPASPAWQPRYGPVPHQVVPPQINNRPDTPASDDRLAG
ncbi:DivIVA domain-containing protein [Streptomyces iakyrus]|uniref:DivIVA domain-containing protein n=1 Tax=Streptomyces iakyrus TaxID=68219 RepID=UPI000525D428|nr:DivIVA domain-containing protein [Streptomyces iakyrus]